MWVEKGTLEGRGLESGEKGFGKRISQKKKREKEEKREKDREGMQSDEKALLPEESPSTEIRTDFGPGTAAVPMTSSIERYAFWGK